MESAQTLSVLCYLTASPPFVKSVIIYLPSVLQRYSWGCSMAVIDWLGSLRHGLGRWRSLVIRSLLPSKYQQELIPVWKHQRVAEMSFLLLRLAFPGHQRK